MHKNILKAIERDDVNSVRSIFLENDMNIDDIIIPSTNETILHYAAVYLAANIVDWAIQQNADVRKKSQVGDAMTALCSFAVGHSITVDTASNRELQQLECARLLIKAGADVTQQSEALSRACMNRVSLIVDLLIANGANVNVPDKYDLLPLHHAVHASDVNLIRILIMAGANPSISSQTYGLPITLCDPKNSDYDECVTLLNGGGYATKAAKPRLCADHGK